MYYQKNKDKIKERVRLYRLKNKRFCEICGVFGINLKSVCCRSCSKKKEKNPKWKGDKVGYHSLHIWIRSHKPKPKLCEICGLNQPFEVANVSGKYKRDINDFEWLCKSCHSKKDNKIKNMRGNQNGRN